MMENTKVSRIAGMISGMRIRLAIWMPLAPSTRAAS